MPARPAPLTDNTDPAFVAEFPKQTLHLWAGQRREYLPQFAQGTTFVVVIANMPEQQLLVGFTIKPAYTRVCATSSDRGIEAPGENITDTSSPAYPFHKSGVDQCRYSGHQVNRQFLTAAQVIKDQEVMGRESLHASFSYLLQESDKGWILNCAF